MGVGGNGEKGWGGGRMRRVGGGSVLKLPYPFFFDGRRFLL